MANRREFIQTGVAATAAAVAAGPAPEAAASPAALPIYKVIYDERFEAPVRFAGAAQALGLSAHPIQGDMTAFWYNELHARWRTGPVAIAGMTCHGPMFCLEMLARDCDIVAIGCAPAPAR